MMRFNLPSKSEIIFFDIADDILRKIFKKEKILIINLRTIRKNLNFFILCKILLSFKLIKIFMNDGLMIAYVISYIEYVDAKKVITCIDNNIRFYRLKHYFKNIKFISIQNGLRHKCGDLFGNPELNKELICDKILVFGNSIKKKYEQYIDADVKTVGCYRNNNYNIFRLKKKNTVLFISQFRNYPSSKIISYLGKNIITWGHLNSNLSTLLPNLIKYCDRNNLKFGILSTTGSKKEYEYFRKILGRNKYWKFYKPKTQKESYKILDMNEIIVNVWSTMGMESLSRGNKTCFFKQSDFGFNDRHFGWPKKYIEQNDFYTNKVDYLAVSKILNKMRSIKIVDWKKIVNRYSGDNLTYNFQNNKLIKLIKE